MLMVAHAGAGALVGELSSTPFIAFSISFVLHFLMDLIPHGDHELVANYLKKKQKGRMLMFIFTDIIATILFISGLFLSSLEFNTRLVLWGIIGGLMPDVLVAIYQISKVKILKKFNEIHYSIHGYIEVKKNKTIPLIPGLIMQIGLIIVFLKIAF